ncbi:MAG: alpha/beta hydrolase [Candidatus Bathyarchaeia archaeon]
MVSKKTGKITVAAVAVVIAVIFVGVPLFFTYSIMAGQPRGTDVETPADYGMNYQEFTVATSDGVSIKGWFIPGSNKATVIMIHGGAVGVTKGTAGVIPGGELRHSLLPIAESLHEGGYNVILYDRRLNGESGNGPFTRSVEDVYAVIDYIGSNPSLDSNRIGLWGNSAGGWVAIMAAGERQDLFRAVVADAPVPHFSEAGGWFELTLGLPSFPFYHTMLAMYSIIEGVSLDQVSSYRYVDKISPSAFFLIVESEDRMLPPSSVERLYALAGDPKYIWKDIDAAHVEAYFKYPEEYERRVLAFYDTYLLDLPRQNEIS